MLFLTLYYMRHLIVIYSLIKYSFEKNKCYNYYVILVLTFLATMSGIYICISFISI